MADARSAHARRRAGKLWAVRSDLELLAAWRADDAAAGSELFRRYFDPLYRFFVNKVAGDAEDLMQNTWMACVRYGDHLERASSFRAYLFTVARNELYRHLRARRPSADVDFGASSIADLSPSPMTVLGSAERERRLLGALRSLPVESQITLELHYWEDLSTAELAEILEVPQGTAKTRLRRAKQLLDQALRRGRQPTDTDAIDRWVRSMREKVSGSDG
jgi:RNA polymerase sigma factor (sigma-70 family)